MDRFVLFFIVFGVVCYFVGVIFAHKTTSAILRLFSLLKNPLNSLKEFCKSQGDRIFLILIISIPVGTLYFFYKTLELDKLIQFLIVEGTFFAVIYSVLIRDNSSQYRGRPKIGVRFDDSKSHCYHKTTLYDSTPTWNGAIINSPLTTYYISAEVVNEGQTMLENVEVILQKVESDKPLTNPFLPLNLNWSFKGESIVIPPHGASRLINVIEVREPGGTGELLAKLRAGGGGQDWDRYLELSRGFRSCSVKPNTLSDIFPKGKYTFHLVVTASNAEPKPIKMLITYDGKWDKSTPIEDMRRTHLKIKLLKQDE
jgi:hypothetical protein